MGYAPSSHDNHEEKEIQYLLSASTVKSEDKEYVKGLKVLSCKHSHICSKETLKYMCDSHIDTWLYQENNFQCDWKNQSDIDGMVFCGVIGSILVALILFLLSK